MTSSRLGTYELVESLHQGGLAEVFLARRVGQTPPAPITLKRLAADAVADPKRGAHIPGRAREAMALEHPHILRIFEVGEDAGSTFLATEYLAGRPLRAVLAALSKKKERLELPLALFIAARLGEALVHAHAAAADEGQGIVHAAISPDSVRIGLGGEVKLEDYGFMAGVWRQRSVPKNERLGFLSPEQMSGAPSTPATDLFALGLVLYELVIGKRLYGPAPRAMRLQELLDGAPPPLDADLPETLKELLLKVLARQPGDRFQSAEELLEALRRIEEASPGGAGSAADLAALMARTFPDAHSTEAQRQTRLVKGPPLSMSSPSSTHPEDQASTPGAAAEAASAKVTSETSAKGAPEAAVAQPADYSAAEGSAGSAPGTGTPAAAGSGQPEKEETKDATPDAPSSQHDPKEAASAEKGPGAGATASATPTGATSSPAAPIAPDASQTSAPEGATDTAGSEPAEPIAKGADPASAAPSGSTTSDTSKAAPAPEGAANASAGAEPDGTPGGVVADATGTGKGEPSAGPKAKSVEPAALSAPKLSPVAPESSAPKAKPVEPAASSAPKLSPVAPESSAPKAKPVEPAASSAPKIQPVAPESSAPKATPAASSSSAPKAKPVEPAASSAPKPAPAAPEPAASTKPLPGTPISADSEVSLPDYRDFDDDDDEDEQTQLITTDMLVSTLPAAEAAAVTAPPAAPPASTPPRKTAVVTRPSSSSRPTGTRPATGTPAAGSGGTSRPASGRTGTRPGVSEAGSGPRRTPTRPPSGEVRATSTGARRTSSRPSIPAAGRAPTPAKETRRPGAQGATPGPREAGGSRGTGTGRTQTPGSRPARRPTHGGLPAVKGAPTPRTFSASHPAFEAIKEAESIPSARPGAAQPKMEILAANPASTPGPEPSGQRPLVPVPSSRTAPTAPVRSAAAPGGSILDSVPKSLWVVTGLVLLLLMLGLGFSLRSPSDSKVVVHVTPTEGALITLDGRQLQSGEPISLPPGEYELVAIAEGHKRHSQRITVFEDAEQAVYPITLEPDAASLAPIATGPGIENAGTFTVKFTTSTPGVEIWVEGTSIGTAPEATAILPIGRPHRYEARAKGYEATMGTVGSYGDPEVTVQLTLQPAVDRIRNPNAPPTGGTGRLVVATEPNGAEIYVNGVPTGRRTPITSVDPLTLPAGKHRLRFALGDRVSRLQNVTLERGQTILLDDVAIDQAR